ncbi:MAG: response regulator [Actinomycetota bacterium]
MKVLIVDDHKLFAEAIRALLEEQGMEVWVAGGAEEALAAVRSQRPDLALVDLNMPGVGGMELGRQILDQFPGIKVLALTALEDPRAVTQAARAGFHGYLMKDASMTEFVASIRTAVNGGLFLAPHRLAAPAAGARTEEERHALLLADRLTSREREVLTMLVQGATSRQIARHLSIAPNTVRTHIQSILTKLQVHSRLEAAAFAVRYGLVRLPRGNGS